MNISISIENFNTRKAPTIIFLTTYFMVSIAGAGYIIMNSTHIQTTYFLTLNTERYLEQVFLIFYPLVVIVFLSSHIRINKWVDDTKDNP